MSPLRLWDAVLIDDDPLVRETWLVAAELAQKKLKVFKSAENFFIEAASLARDTPIYIDSELGGRSCGEEESRRIHSLGFGQIYLATGRDARDFAAYKHLRGIVGKTPPWRAPAAASDGPGNSAADSWDPLRCNLERPGVGLANAAEWLGSPLPVTQTARGVEPYLTRNKLRRVPKVDVLLTHKGGMGDSLMCSAISYELRRRGVGNVWLETRWNDDFRGQPIFDGVLEESLDTERLVEEQGGKIIYPAYARAILEEDREIGPSHHIIAEMCRQAGILGRVHLRPYFIADRTVFVALPKEFVAIGVQGSFGVTTKNWFLDRYHALADLIGGRLPVVQLGATSEPRLNGCIDLRGQTNLKQAAAILGRARCFVGQVGGLMHLARAVECPSVIIYGGRETPAQSGYTANDNLIGAVPCSPCWIIKNCPHDMDCMKLIRAEDVASRVFALLDSPRRRTLPVDEFMISA